MFAELTRSLLGKYGVMVLDFYLEHQMPINAAVVLYGAAMIYRGQWRRKNAAKGKTDAGTEDNRAQ